MKCIVCKRVLSQPVHTAPGGGIVGTVAGTRKRPNVHWCQECWEANVKFNKESAEQAHQELMVKLRAAGYEV